MKRQVEKSNLWLQNLTGVHTSPNQFPHSSQCVFVSAPITHLAIQTWSLTLDGDDPDLNHPQPEPSLTWLAYQGSGRDRTYHVVWPPPPYDHWRDTHQTVCVCVLCVPFPLSLFEVQRNQQCSPPSTKQCEATAPSCLHFRGRGHVKTAHGSALPKSRLQVEHSHGSSGATETALILHTPLLCFGAEETGRSIL